MCGIYLTNIPFNKDEVNVKLNKIKYRGPDCTKVLKREDVTLGHLRLAILDLDHRANQPYQYKEFTIVYNGEIYNFKEIREELTRSGYSFQTTGDTEVLIKAYDMWNEKILDKLNGMFAFAIYDSKTRKIFCARDRLGVKPFYYYWKDGQFEICSQLQPLINKSSKISTEAVSIYLDYGYVPSPLSILENIFKLQPGKYMVFDLNTKSIEITEYWNLNKVKTIGISYDEAKIKLKTLIQDAVRIRMESDVPIGTFLSGGIDSSLVTALATKMSNNKIKTFTIAFDDPKYNESKVAERFSNVLGTEHKTTTCRVEDLLELVPKLFEVYDEPFADSSALPSLLLNKVTKEHVTVALSGDGGDESFLGYIHFDLLHKFKTISGIPFFIRKLLAKTSLYKFLNIKKETFESLFLSKNSRAFSNAIFYWFDSLQKKRATKWHSAYSQIFSKLPLQYQADYNIKLWLENDSNVKVDRASMAYSMEVRSPFLDYRIVEFARTLPIEYRYKKGNKKRIIKDLLEEFIPRELFDLPKKGFSIPLGMWIKNELRDDILSALDDDFLESVPNLNTVKFKQQFAKHLQGESNYAFNIWKLYVLHGWLKQNNLSL